MNYKGFEKNLKCRGFQYEIGKEYEEPTVNCCHSGFHACENPLDVFSYYPPSDSRYCEVEQSGEIDKSGNDSKITSTKIKIGTEIGLKSLIKDGLSFVMERVKATTGNSAHSTTTGKNSIAVAVGRNSAASASSGSYIVLAEYDEWNGNEYPLLGVKSAIVDGEILKANTYYTLKNGEFVEVK